MKAKCKSHFSPVLVETHERFPDPETMLKLDNKADLKRMDTLLSKFSDKEDG
jgi:hypothetical protein